MEYNILLNNKKSKTSSSSDYTIPFQFDRNATLTPSSYLHSDVDLMEIYNSERSACTSIRLTCEVNPIVSNVLFNPLSEWYKYDTKKDEYNYGYCGSGMTIETNNSENSGKTYMYGLDIFNNHLLRNTSFKTSLNQNGLATSNADYYGKTSYSISDGKNNVITKVNLYSTDDILSFEDCVSEKLVEKNGWFGFYNKPTMNALFSKNGNASYFMTDNTSEKCEFVDLYPSRDLFYFTPKYNSIEKREEKNWEYCITYPYSSTTKGIDFINTPLKSLKTIYHNGNASYNGQRCLKIRSIAKHGLLEGDYVNLYMGINESPIAEHIEVVSVEDEYAFLVIHPSIEVGTYVYSGDTSKDGEYIEFEEEKIWGDEKNNFTVMGGKIISGKVDDTIDVCSALTINDEKYYIKEGTDENGATLYHIQYNGIDFSFRDLANKTFVYVEDNGGLKEVSGTISAITPTVKRGNMHLYDDNGNGIRNTDLSKSTLSFKKSVNYVPCDYYVRLFRRIPNWKYSKELVTKENYSKLMETDESKKYDFESHCGSLAFSKNIYNDEISEVVFSDGINFDYLKDNIGRPLSDLYFTTIKNNTGYDQLKFEKDNNSADSKNVEFSSVSGKNVEFSSAFGKVSCGFMLCDDYGINEKGNSQDVRTINRSSVRTNEGIKISGSTEIIPKTSYDGKIKRSDIFIGDLCYYSPSEEKEFQIQMAYHRINTRQRDSIGESAITWNKIAYDEYDGKASPPYSASVETLFLSDTNMRLRGEGYIYIPHYKIPIRTFSSVMDTIFPQSIRAKKSSYLASDSDNTKGFISYSIITSSENHFYENEIINLYDSVNNLKYICKVRDVSPENGKSIKVDVYSDCQMDLTNIRYRFFANDSIPYYAHMINDGSCRYLFRNIIQNGYDDSSDNEKYPFANGYLYVNIPITIYMGRQDPEKIFKIGNMGDGITSDSEPNVIQEEDKNNYYEESDIKC